MKSSNEIAPRLLQLLGVHDMHIHRTTIVMQADRAVEITIECYPDDMGDTRELVPVVKRYRLVED